jgi:hypothetical protein
MLVPIPTNAPTNPNIGASGPASGAASSSPIAAASPPASSAAPAPALAVGDGLNVTAFKVVDGVVAGSGTPGQVDGAAGFGTPGKVGGAAGSGTPGKLPPACPIGLGALNGLLPSPCKLLVLNNALEPAC